MHGYKTPKLPRVMVNKASYRALWHLQAYTTGGIVYHVNEGFDIAHSLTMQNSMPINGLEGVKQLFALPSSDEAGLIRFYVSYGEITDNATRFYPIVSVIADDYHSKFDWIIRNLPHGSGINYDWSTDFGRKYITCKCAYEQDSYDGGPVSFTVRYVWDNDMQKPHIHDVKLGQRSVMAYDDEGKLYNDRDGLLEYLYQALDLS